MRALTHAQPRPATLMVLATIGAILLSAVSLAAARPVGADHTSAPASVTFVGSMQSELGCPGDWEPACGATALTYDAEDGAWQGSFSVPAGDYEYKAALNGAWAENYGANATPDGANIALGLGADATVPVYYSHATHWIADSLNAVIVTAPGSWQSELGCLSDWDPGCLRTWLQDPDGDGVHTLTTTALPPGTYETKVAIDESWAENYGAGGVPGGPNIAFTVGFAGQQLTFSYDESTHLLTVDTGAHAADDNVEWDGVRHDSRDELYRTPGGAVPAGTPVTLRLRTFHGDVTGVKLRLYSLDRAGQELLPMSPEATDVSCYEEALAGDRCDFWAVTLPNADPDNLWYRFVVSDGTDTDFHGDNTAALDGGLGVTTDEQIDRSWALMVHEPGFSAPAWASEAVIYQIFPDRFRSGRSSNDPVTGDLRYDDPVIRLPWGTKPEGYCRNYADGATSCPWRFDETPPADSPTKEQPRGRDYMGGDLRGVDQQLDYLAALGVTAIYFNPVFDAGSNHSYDTQDYTRIDPYFGTERDWQNLVKHAAERGIRIILDGVFNHLSSDSPFFDRYGHYPTVGACESVDSEFRDWFTFTPQEGGPCVGPDGPNTMAYAAWFGFDSIPVLDKANAEVQAYFLTADDAIATRWLDAGAGGWRMDVSGDASFPDGYWETFRGVVKGADPEALTISETWQKDSTLLRMLRGDRLDTTMNYRLRDAVLGLLAPGGFDSKGFADSGRVITPTEFANRIASVREDYPDAAYYTLMNLLDSHDTERLLWTLTPGAETTAEREETTANVAAGKARLRIASLIQFTMPGAPTVYYGDEAGMTGDDDPDDRRTFPWADRGGSPDAALQAHYTGLAGLRQSLPALTAGDISLLLADDAAGTVAYGRATDASAAVVAINRSDTARMLTIPVAGHLPDGTSLEVLFAANAPASGSATVADGTLSVEVPPLAALVLGADGLDLAGPAAPADLRVTGESANTVELSWSAVAGAAGYRLYVSPLRGGGYLPVTESPISGTSHAVTGLENARTYHFLVRALDELGNEGAASNQVAAIPHLVIGWANVQWPPAMSHTISTTDRTDEVYGQVWIDGVTGEPGPTPSLRAQLGFGPDGSDPSADASGWSWAEASFNVDAGNNDEFVASLQPEWVGSFDYAYRYTVTGGRDWVYADLSGIQDGYSASEAGQLTVEASGDAAPPAVPANLVVLSASPGGVELGWDAVTGDATLHGYEVGRSESSGGPYSVLATVTGEPRFTDATVGEGATYRYVVRTVDTSFNRSGWSAEAEATAALRRVEVVFTVTVPGSTDDTGRAVHIAGFLDRLEGGLPQWDPAGVQLERVDATHWTVTLFGEESTQLEYKYALGAWDYVEKGAACDEIANRQVELAYGDDGVQRIDDTVLNWRNVAPCGN